ncbi:GNAT family N-acetyltransferase [uncultured Ramlibacter sp.]|uniref:GNAT family N-acetyltransferase n=1 Tax=uncultured Ramlibacter sp. TaxID=260755 RepID=UPI0026379AB2|nr:GNAT family N-acetyltransferase [uncultured Ramlibacter sp.]
MPSSAPQVRIEPMQEADMACVLAVQAQCYTAIVPESAQSLRAKLLAAPQSCFVARRGAAMVGYLVALPLRWPELPALDSPDCLLPAQPDTLYLHDLALAAPARGSGAGRALVDAALAQAALWRLPQAALVAIQDSARYWQALGFRALAAQGQPLQAKLASYGAGAVLMRKELL